MNKLLGLGIFIAGAAVGVAGSSIYFKKKYEEIAEEEINSVRAVLSRRSGVTDRLAVKPEPITKEKPDLMAYSELIKKTNYSTYSEKTQVPETNKAVNVDAPEEAHIINEDEYSENDDYECATLMYYADGVLCDDNDDIIEECDYVNSAALTAIKLMEEHENCMYVYTRNDRLKIDYEFCRDTRTYARIRGLMSTDEE